MTCLTRKAIAEKAYDSLGLKTGSSSLEAKLRKFSNRFITGC